MSEGVQLKREAGYRQLYSMPVMLMFSAVVLLLWSSGLRLAQLGREGFWLDELFGASYTGLSLFETLVAVLRFDLHPPLYYLQLNIWSWLGKSDEWLLANSAAWSIATLLILSRHAFVRHGSLAALFVLAIVGICGSELFYAAELRMYAMYACLVAMAWVAANQYIESYSIRKDGWRLVLLLFVIACIHSTAFLSIGALLAYAFPWDNLKSRERLRSWMIVASLATLFLLPWLANASVRSVSHTAGFSVLAILRTLSGWFVGYASPGWAPISLGIVACIVVLILAVMKGPYRKTILCLIVFPLAMAASVSMWIRPIWIPRIFSFSAPIFMYVLAVTLFNGLQYFTKGKLSAHAAIASVCLVLFTLGIGWRVLALNLEPHKAEYREAAHQILATAKPGEYVYIPQNVLFWGVARYLVGNEWGSILKIQDPEKVDLSSRWSDIYRRIGNDNLRFLGLLPESRVLNSGAVPLVIGWTPYAPLDKVSSFWLVTDYSINPATLGLCRHADITTQKFRGLRLHHVICGKTDARA